MVLRFHDGLYFPFIWEIETMYTTIVVVIDQYVIVSGQKKRKSCSFISFSIKVSRHFPPLISYHTSNLPHSVVFFHYFIPQIPHDVEFELDLRSNRLPTLINLPAVRSWPSGKATVWFVSNPLHCSKEMCWLVTG